MKENKIERMQQLVKSSALSQEELETLRNQEYRDVVLAYTLSIAAEEILTRAQKAINLEAPYRRFKDKHNMSGVRKLIEEALRRMDQGQLEIDDIFYKNEGDEAYPRIRNNAYEIIRLVQLHYDRCMDNEKATMSIQRAYNRLAPKGLFTEEETTIHLQ